MALWWAQAVLLASWWVVWGGFGDRVLEQAGLHRWQVLAGVGLIWLVGWTHVVLVRSWGPLDGGFVLLGTGGALLLLGARRRGLTLGWIGLGLLATLVRGVVPVEPGHATLMPWLVAEAILLGLAAAVVALDAVPAAAVAAAASVFAGIARLGLAPGVSARHEGDWLFSVLACLTAFAAGWILARMLGLRPSPVNRPSRIG